MKYLFIGDIHIDKYKDLIDENIHILESFLDNDVKNVIIPGDVFESHEKTNTYAVNKLQSFFEKYDEKFFYILIGNHDIYYKNKLHPNSLTNNFSHIKNCLIIDKPYEFNEFLLVPWICEENYEECIDAIKKSNKKYCVGHFDFNGFYVVSDTKYRNSILKISYFNKFKRVISSHFHIRQEIGNILYLGSIKQTTWNDFKNIKGYHILDVSTDEMIFFNKSKEIYKHLILENKDSDFEIDEYKDCHIKIFHNEKLSKKQFDKIELLTKEVRSYKIFDESFELNEVKIERIEFSEVLNEFFQHQHEIEDDFKNDVKDYLLMKYNEG